MLAGGDRPRRRKGCDPSHDGESAVHGEQKARGHEEVTSCGKDRMTMPPPRQPEEGCGQKEGQLGS